MVLLLVGEDPEMVPAVKKAASLQIPVIVIQVCMCVLVHNNTVSSGQHIYANRFGER